MNGIDISSYQGVNGLDLSIVPSDFVIIKATQGSSYVNPYFERYYKQAIENNKKIGIYHYVDGSDIKSQATHFLGIIGDKYNQAILCLDWEGMDNSEFDNNSHCIALLNEIYERIGRHPFLYLSKSVARNQDWSSIASYTPLWVAQYPNYERTGYLKEEEIWTDEYDFGAWNKPTIFQYTSSGLLEGYSEPLDLNFAYLTPEQWDKYVRGEIVEQLIVDSVESVEDVEQQVEQEPQENVYYVQPNDTLSDIANRFGTDYQTLANINGIENPNIIYVGQPIKLVGDAPIVDIVEPQNDNIYVVQSGDTLSGIGANLGLDWGEIASLNGIYEPYVIYTGQELMLPNTIPQPQQVEVNLDDIATRVYRGEFGNGADRENALIGMGYNPSDVQARLEEMYY